MLNQPELVVAEGALLVDTLAREPGLGTRPRTASDGSGASWRNAIRIEVTCDTCPPADLAHLVEVAERGCLVVATLRQGMEVVASAAVR